MTTTTSRKSLLSHETCHPFARGGNPLRLQSSMNTWTPIHLSTRVIDCLNVFCKLVVFPLMLTHRTFHPRIVAAQRDTKRFTEHTDRIVLSILFHDLVPHSWPCEKILTVFFRISRSWRVLSSSRLRRRFSSSKAV